MGTILGILILFGIIGLICLAFVGRDAERDLNAPEPNYEAKFKKKQR